MNVPWILGAIVLGIVAAVIVWKSREIREWLDDHLPEDYWAYAIILAVVVFLVAVGLSL